MTEPEVSAMADLLTALGTGVTQFFTWIGDGAEMIITTPLFQFGLVLLVVGVIAGFIGRFWARG